MNSGEPCLPMSVVRRMTGLSERQIRYYDRMGLVSPKRTPGGHRLYSQREVERLLEVKALIRKSMDVSDVRAYLREREERHQELISDRKSYFDRPRSRTAPLTPPKGALRGRNPEGTSLKSLYPLEARPEVMKTVDHLRSTETRRESEPYAEKRSEERGSLKETE